MTKMTEDNNKCNLDYFYSSVNAALGAMLVERYGSKRLVEKRDYEEWLKDLVDKVRGIESMGIGEYTVYVESIFQPGENGKSDE